MARHSSPPPKKNSFLKNFWEGFHEVLGRNHVIKSLDKCDFTPMFEYHMAEREKKKAMTKEVRRGRRERRAFVEGASGVRPLRRGPLL